MRDIWTNTTWANWLRSKGVPERHYALLEMKGNGLPVKVIATAKKGEALYALIPHDKRWHISYWWQLDRFPVVGSLHPSVNQLAALKKFHVDKRRKKR